MRETEVAARRFSEIRRPPASLICSVPVGYIAKQISQCAAPEARAQRRVEVSARISVNSPLEKIAAAVVGRVIPIRIACKIPQTVSMNVRSVVEQTVRVRIIFAAVADASIGDRIFTTVGRAGTRARSLENPRRTKPGREHASAASAGVRVLRH